MNLHELPQSLIDELNRVQPVDRETFALTLAETVVVETVELGTTRVQFGVRHGAAIVLAANPSDTMHIVISPSANA